MGQEDLKILKTVFGFDEYLAGQERIIAEILSGKDVLTIMPTGGGKSLCYQLPALMFKGMTVVVSPLIALMQSQVAQLQLLGIKAASLNSSNTFQENRNTLNMLDTNELKMLYAAPERSSHRKQ
jgi:ATP-dependent DNA helicase RecQ